MNNSKFLKSEFISLYIALKIRVFTALALIEYTIFMHRLKGFSFIYSEQLIAHDEWNNDLIWYDWYEQFVEYETITLYYVGNTYKYIHTFSVIYLFIIDFSSFLYWFKSYYIWQP